MKIKELAAFALLSALLLIVQAALAFLPNIELVSLLVILYTLFFKKKALIPLYAFVLLEGLLYGFSLWWLNYLYVWLVLSLVTLLFRKETAPLLFALLSGCFGLLFGTLCSAPYFFIGGAAMGFSYIINGIPFDLVHGVSNFFVTLALFSPLRACLKHLYTRL